MFVTWALTAILLSLLSYYYLHRRNKYFERLGISGPPALPVLGNLPDFARVPFGLRVQQWAATYGKVFGVFEGGSPGERAAAWSANRARLLQCL